MELLGTSFTPVPVEDRQSPARVLNINCRFYTEKRADHKEALDFYEQVAQFFGDKSKAAMWALARLADAIDEGRVQPVVEIQPRQRRGEGPSKSESRSWRARYDCYLEHRRAWDLYNSFGSDIVPLAFLYARNLERSRELIAA